MAVKLVVMYPRPNDIDAIEYIYKNEHAPLVVENLRGKTKIVARKILSSPLPYARNWNNRGRRKFDMSEVS